MVHEQGMEFWQICRFDDPVAVLRILLEAVIHAGHPGGDGKTDPPLLKETAEVIEEFERRAHASYSAVRPWQGQDRKSFLKLHAEHRATISLRVAHFTRGGMMGSREFVDGWIEANRSAVKGRSQLERKRGARSLERRALRGLYSLRDPRN